MPKVLIVEDNTSVRIALILQMRAEGEIADVTGLVSARKAIQTEGPFDVAIIDLNLPSEHGLDPDTGFEVIRFIEEMSPATSCIVLTIRNDRDAYERAKKFSSVRYFFTKPWSSHELKQAVKACFKKQTKGLMLRGNVEEDHVPTD